MRQNDGSDIAADIYLIHADSQKQINLTNSPDHEWGPVWLPDSHSIAYVSSSKEVSVLDIRCAISGAAACVRRLEIGVVLAQTPRWSSNGQQLVFEALAGRDSQLYLINADGSQLRPVAGVGSSQAPVWSP